MIQSNPGMLIQILQQEINLIEKLILLLSEEKNALATRQFEALESLAIQKQDISNQLEQHTRTRVDLLGLENQTKQPKQALEEFLAQCSQQEAEQINLLNKTLAEKLILCRELNIVNGQVIASNINTRQEIINDITGQSATDASSVYTASGNIKSSTDSSNHQKA